MSKRPARSRLPAGLIALRERNFLLYTVGQFTSQLGSWIELTAVSWIIYEMTDSPFLLGLVGLFRATPTIMLALFGGAIADRVPRRLLLMCTESTMLTVSLTLGILAYTGDLEYWHLYALNLTSGTLQAFSVPSRHALFAGLVPRSSMSSAVVLNSVAVRGGGFIGPTIAGLALAYGGYSLPFFMNAVSFVAMIAALWMMRIPKAQAEATDKHPPLREGIKEGLAFVWRTPFLRVALLLELATGLFGHNAALITIIVRDVLQSGPESLGLGEHLRFPGARDEDHTAHVGDDEVARMHLHAGALDLLVEGFLHHPPARGHLHRTASEYRKLHFAALVHVARRAIDDHAADFLYLCRQR